MRCATHVSALKSVFDGVANPITGSSILAAKMGVTSSIINDYIEKLGGLPTFQAWLAAAQAGNRILVKSAGEAPACLRELPGKSADYGAASYFSGGRFYIDDIACPFVSCEKLQALGIDVSSTQAPPPSNIEGDNPVWNLSLATGGAIGFDVLDRFIVPEEEIIIYDKYVNALSLDLIAHIASKMCAGSTLHIRTTRVSPRCKSPEQILARVLNANSRIQCTAKEVSIAFRQMTHDRYIFFGQRLQAVFTAGLDCFGKSSPSGNRINKQSKINLYSIDGFAKLHIEAIDGTVLEARHVELL